MVAADLTQVAEAILAPVFWKKVDKSSYAAPKSRWLVNNVERFADNQESPD